MSLQIIQDGYGKNTGIFIPMKDWELIIEKHEDLKYLITQNNPPKRIADLVGKLSNETAKKMLNYVAESREEWEK
jgi:hypothetical protein